ncbi:MAG: hypothetical protein AB2N28_0210 [Candidatus Phytoplasma solani]
MNNIFWKTFLEKYHDNVSNVVYFVTFTVLVGYLPFIFCILDDCFQVSSFIKSLLIKK